MQQLLSSSAPGSGPAEVTTYVTHPLMIIYPRKVESERSFVIDCRSTEPPLIVENPILVWALSALPEAFTESDARSIWMEEPAAAEIVDQIWTYLCEERLILPQEEAGLVFSQFKLWEEMGWPEAGVYHEATRDYPFVDMSRRDAFKSDNERMKDYEADWSAPDCYQTLPAAKTIPLQKVDDSFADYVAARTPSNCDRLKDLSLIFDFCFGERLRLEHSYDEENFMQLESLRKTIPSGGGRHPTEIFIVVLDQSIGVDKGLYHYNVKNNSLELLKQGALEGDLRAFLPTESSEPTMPQAHLFFTSICERAMWRYRDPRSWRAIAIDVGHAEYMCKQVCGALGFKLASRRNFDAAKAAEFLQTDRFRQPVMSLASLHLTGGG